MCARRSRHGAERQQSRASHITGTYGSRQGSGKIVCRTLPLYPPPPAIKLSLDSRATNDLEDESLEESCSSREG
eukprot:scaffold42816_cov30-Prasinocladus_malaysianus.AAC.2